jgi:hypothetical protein
MVLALHSGDKSPYLLCINTFVIAVPPFFARCETFMLLLCMNDDQHTCDFMDIQDATPAGRSKV